MEHDLRGNTGRILRTDGGTNYARPWIETFIDKWLMLTVVVGAIALVIIASLVFLNQTRLELLHAQQAGRTKYDNLGSFIGGVSLFLGALLVWIEATLIKRNALLRDEKVRVAERTSNEARVMEQRYISAVTSFRALYEEFWGEDIVSEVRRWIISEEEYNTIKGVLIERNNDPSKEGNKLQPCANLKLDKLDRFLSTLVRIRPFNLSEEYQFINDDQKVLWNKVINREFWIRFVYKHRPELWTYLYNHWRDDLLPSNAPERYDPNVELQF